MLFFHPMWDSETQRLGKKACTPVGYALHVLAEMIGFLGLIVFAISGVVVFWRWLAGTPGGVAGWSMLVALGLGVISEVVFWFSWWLASRRGFRYDGYEASWSDHGEPKNYKFTA
jgi:hypothetical protein